MRARWIGAALAAVGAAGIAQAQDHQTYVSLSGGAAFPRDSDDRGALAAAFVSGDGGSIPAGTAYDAGTPVRWTTALDTGFTVAGALGAATASGWRGEVELAYASTDVDGHSGATLGGAPIGAADAGLFFPGSAALGQSVDAFLAADDGSLESTYLMLNAYFDFNTVGWIVTPYVGGGVGVAFVDVNYAPQGLTLIEDEDNVFAYQLIGGGTLAAADRIEVFAQGRYRATGDVRARGIATEIAIPLALELDLESEGFVLEGGLRYRF